jgi:hypothetical protein
LALPRTLSIRSARRFVDALVWLPALVACVYVATVVALFPRLIHGLYWHSDAAALPVIAEALRGSGDVIIPHLGVWSSLWWLLATRDLPGHVQLWEATGYAFALAGVALVGWATARVAGLWAGVTAAAIALMLGPDALRWLLSVNFHVSTPFTAAVLAAYLVALPRRRSLLLAALVGLIAGVNAASDPLLWVAGIAPFAIAVGCLAYWTRRRDVAGRGGLVLGLAVISALSTSAIMESLGFRAVLRENHLAALQDLPANAVHFARIVALLGGANYTFPPGYPLDPIRPLIALLVLLGVTVPVVVGLRLLLVRADPILRSYAVFWASAVLVLGASIIGTPNASDLGPLSVHYTFTLALAVGAGVALLASRSRRAQLAVALVVAAIGVSNVVGLAQGRADHSGGAIERYERPVTAMLVRKGITRGYAGYWNAQSLTWNSGMRLLVAPVTWDRHIGLCRYRWNTIDSWFEDRGGPTFLIVDPTTPFMNSTPTFVDRATEVRRYGPLTVYLFDYDLARHFPAAKGPTTPCRT